MAKVKTKFWMLYREGGRIPSHKHLDLGDAKVEAERIARRERRRVYILEAFASVKVETKEVPEVPVIWSAVGEESETPAPAPA